MPWSYKPNNYQGSILRAVTSYYRIPDNVRFRDLNEKQQNILLYGDDPSDEIEVRFRTKTGTVWRLMLNGMGFWGLCVTAISKQSRKPCARILKNICLRASVRLAKVRDIAGSSSCDGRLNPAPTPNKFRG